MFRMNPQEHIIPFVLYGSIAFSGLRRSAMALESLVVQKPP
jgi:hypothetical protein